MIAFFFIKTKYEDIIIVQNYVYDVIFGATNESLCKEFENMMHKELEKYSIGELKFLLKLQIK